jgi:hypothetical protein
MIYLVSNSIKKKLVLIFQEILSQHPIFEKVKVYTKFPQEERPKTAILVRSVSGGSQKLGLNNFICINRAYSTLANIKGSLGNSIEWIKDDQENLDKLSTQGFYIVKIIKHDVETNNFEFVVDPYFNCIDEELNISPIRTKEGAILKNYPVNPDSEIVFSQSCQFEFKRDIDYSINYDTGEILFTGSVSKYLPIVVDYQILGEQQGPFVTEYYSYNNVAIPGVIIAFGDRLKVGDEQVVVIDKVQRDVAKVFGGRWVLNVDVICVAQDADQQERVLDFIATSLWANYQDELTNEGIALTEFTLSGESEDLELEIAEEYNYSAGFSFMIETDWEVHVPLISELRRVNYGYGDESFKDTIDYTNEEKYEKNQYDNRMINSKHQKGLQITPSLELYQPCNNTWPRITKKY